MIDMHSAEACMTAAGIDAWLLYDFRGGNPVFWQVLGETKHSTRRNFLLIPRNGKAGILAHAIDADLFRESGLKVDTYVSWQDLRARLREMLAPFGRIAMEYSPGSAIPIISYVDAGMLELVRSLGVEVVSSAELHQNAAARWDAKALEAHRSACRLVSAAKDAAFAFIGQSIAAGRAITEYDVQQFTMGQFTEHGLETDDPPIVGVNRNSGDPHYQPTAARSSPIRAGDWVLLDLWAKHPGERNVFADITWVAFVGGSPRPEYQRIFEIVKRARDSVVSRLKEAWRAGEELMGWQADQVARGIIEQAGYGRSFFHRTGHSMGPGNTVHALGVNLDDLETHDTRRIVPGVGFSVEPGIYLPEFGVRSEINVYVDPQDGPTVTTEMQERIVLIG